MSPGSSALRILMVASEAVPFAKTGGLADVVGALPLALDRLGHTVTVVMPRYRSVDAESLIDEQTLRFGARSWHVRWLAESAGTRSRFVFLDCPELFDRDALYGVGNLDYPDNALRFGVLSRAAVAFAERHAAQAHVLHAHDWQTGLAPVYLRTRYGRHPALGRCGIVFTLHNLAYQGVFDPSWLPILELEPGLMHSDALEYWGRFSFLKGGINFSDMITTVSRAYAREILTPELGFGFDGMLRRRQADLVGILNGIDTDTWDPSCDEHLPHRYSADDLSGKVDAKRALLEEVGLPADKEHLRRPLVGMVSRLVDQKGFDILAAAASELLALDATYVLLGSGDTRYEDLWRALARRHPSRVAARIGFDDRLAHLIEGGADIFLMPSRFEPCGLNQMYSLRYGTVPVVRATGGLDDTVEDFDERAKTGTGFKFRDPLPDALVWAVRRAVRTYGEDPEAWRRIQQAGMRQNHSWDASAAEYVKVYRAAAERASGRLERFG